jgi:hypothetical protein
MAERKYVDDLRDLMHAAEVAITQALRDGGENGHKNGDWLQHGYGHHLKHADGHVAYLSAANTEELGEDELREALSHAICRLVMAWSRREKHKTAIV